MARFILRCSEASKMLVYILKQGRISNVLTHVKKENILSNIRFTHIPAHGEKLLLIEEAGN